MKKFSLLALLFILVLASCRIKHQPGTPLSSEIPIDSANKMISSYLNSINYTEEDSNIHSFILDGASLRDYLNSPEGESITQMKIFMGHTLDYINSGHQDQNCGYNEHALALIVAGYDEEGNYIYSNLNKVLDHTVPCPSRCPVEGQAAENFFPVPETKK